MKLQSGQPAPRFRTQDVYGNSIDLQKSKGRKVYLAFERNAGCPVCNLRMHELFKKSEMFAERNIEMIFVYESPLEKMREYLGDNTYPFHFVSDPTNQFYDRFGVQRSFLKVFNSVFHGLMSRIRQGSKLFRKPMKQDGHMDRIPAEFIVGENGNLEHVHYGRFVGDHLPSETLFRLLEVRGELTNR